MRAAVLRAPHTQQIEELDQPEPQAGEVRVRLVASGLCRSDLHAYEGRVPVPLPAVLGHEGAGVIDQLGPNVTDLAVGDHVVMTITPGCGTCFQCQLGAYGLCEVGAPHFLDGGLIHGQRRLSLGDESISHYLMQSSFAEFAVVERWNAVKIDKSIPLEIACLAACGLSTGFGAAINRAQISVGETVLVVGVGGVGLSAAIGAASAGAARVIVADTSAAACALALELGATDAIELTADSDLVAEVHRLVPRGVDAAIDAVGTPTTVLNAFNALRHGGRLVILGVADSSSSITLPLYSFVQQKVVTGSTNGSIRPQVDIPRILERYTAGRLPLEKLITSRYSLEDINTAFAEIGQRPGRAVITF
jgi:Zn-dependent alcohol dehydrogenase